MLQEFYRCADKIMRLETAWETVHAGKSTPSETPHETTQAGKSTPTEKNRENKKRKSRDHRISLDANNKKGKNPDQRVLRPHMSKYNNFTDLIRSRENVFLAIEHTSVYKQPDLLRGDRSKRNQNKYCWYHKDVRHTTEECIILKDENKNSTEKDTFEITSTTEVISLTTTRARRDLLVRSGLFLGDRTSSRRREGPKTTISEKPRTDCL